MHVSVKIKIRSRRCPVQVKLHIYLFGLFFFIRESGTERIHYEKVIENFKKLVYTIRVLPRIF
jgi:hypothetical protein